MIFIALIIVLIGVIAYYHYLQGLFSAALSLIIAAISVAVAFGYYEVLVNLLLKGRMADSADGMMLIILFAATYILLRLLFDKLVPGNVRLPVLMDRIGAPICGALAGAMAVGVIAVAAQSLPFGPSIAMYERYTMLWDQQVQISLPEKQQAIDAVYDHVDATRFLGTRADPLYDSEAEFLPAGQDGANRMLVPVDDLVVGFVSLVSSENGSLSNGRPFVAIHPDYLQELFGQRLGLQPGAKHSVLAGDATVGGVYFATELPQTDQEVFHAAVGSGNSGVRVALEDQLKDKPIRTPRPDNVFLIVRTQINANETDKNSYFGFGPANIRLVAKSHSRNYFPIGTLEAGRTLYVAAPSDMLFCGSGKGVDLVFDVPKTEVIQGDAEADYKVAPGVFLEVKRLARVALGKMGDSSAMKVLPVKNAVLTDPPEKWTIRVLRKDGAPAEKVRAALGQPAPKEVPQASLSVSGPGSIAIKNDLFTKVNVGDPKDDIKDGQAAWGTFTIKGRQVQKLQVDPEMTIQRMEQGPHQVFKYAVPSGYKMVKVECGPSAKEPWQWAGELGEYKLMDANDRPYPVQGVEARLIKAQQNSLLVRYDMNKPQPTIDPKGDMRPDLVILTYLVVDTVGVKSFNYKGKPLVEMPAAPSTGRPK